MKRTDYINWDEYFMGIALLTAMRSKDPNSQVGACIVSPENKILSLGYNGMPIGCSDDEMPWEREGDPLDTKYMYVCHAELNAILNSAHNNLKGARVYVTLFPCNECTKAIIQSPSRSIWNWFTAKTSDGLTIFAIEGLTSESKYSNSASITGASLCWRYLYSSC